MMKKFGKGMLYELNQNHQLKISDYDLRIVIDKLFIVTFHKFWCLTWRSLVKECIMNWTKINTILMNWRCDLKVAIENIHFGSVDHAKTCLLKRCFTNWTKFNTIIKWRFLTMSWMLYLIETLDFMTGSRNLYFKSKIKF